jgi:phosphoribosyl 1,2-cyclic phosphodiesterase
LLSVQSLGSGSSGNATLVDDGQTSILVDCGISFAALERGLAVSKRSVDGLKAVIVSHEHVDHIRALPRIMRRGISIACTAGTNAGAQLPFRSCNQVQFGETVSIGTLQVTALAVSHDAIEPCGFFIEARDAAATIVTDLGAGDPELVGSLSRSDLIVIEANHDVARLRRGPYPEVLKRRVLSNRGHLSNQACAELLQEAMRATTRQPTIWLAHLSATNNTPALATSTVVRVLAAIGHTPPIEPLPRFNPSRIWRSTDDPAGFRGTVQLSLPGLS